MRDAFLLDPDTVFLNHGSFGACPAEVFAVYQGWQREMERNPVAFLGRRSGALLVQARAVWAQALGARADDLAFVSNATTGVNIVAQSLPLQPGDEVLATDHEYGACDAAWQHICAQRGAHYRRVAIPLPFCAEEFVPRLMAAVTPRTRMVFASHVKSTHPCALHRARSAACLALRTAPHRGAGDTARGPGFRACLSPGLHQRRRTAGAGKRAGRGGRVTRRGQQRKSAGAQARRRFISTPNANKPAMNIHTVPASGTAVSMAPATWRWA